MAHTPPGMSSMHTKHNATLWMRGSSYYLHWNEGGKRRKLAIGKIGPEAAEEIRSHKEIELLVPKKRTPPLTQYLRPHELERLIACGRGQSQLWSLMANTGLRSSELLRIRWSDVSTIRHRRVLRVASIEDDGPPALMPLRFVPLNASAMKALQSLIKLEDGRLVWQSSEDLLACWKRTRLEGRIAASISVLRRTFAANLVTAGVSLQAVQVLMGYKDLDPVLKYVHLAPGYLTDTANRLEL